MAGSVEEEAAVEDFAASAPLANGSTAYALFTRPLLSGLVAFTIDTSTGKVVARHGVTGPFADYLKLYYGEGTRILPWDPASRHFFLADVDLSGGGAGNASSPIMLYAIDPSTGSSSAARLTGCTGYPMGLAWDAPKNQLLLTTQTEAAVAFYAVDVAKASATALGTVPRGATEQSEGHYAAYLSHAAGGVTYRVGHKKVSSGTELGVGSVAPSSLRAEAPAAATWSDLKWDSHDRPATVHTTDDAFVALAPRMGDHSLSFDVVSWSKSGSDPKLAAEANPRVVAVLNNSHPPTVPLLHTPLGYVGASLVGSRYGAMTVSFQSSGVPIPGLGDKWQIVTLDLAATDGSAAARELPLTPQPSWEGAETVSLSGFGLAA